MTEAELTEKIRDDLYAGIGLAIGYPSDDSDEVVDMKRAAADAAYRVSVAEVRRVAAQRDEWVKIVVAERRERMTAEAEREMWNQKAAATVDELYEVEAERDRVVAELAALRDTIREITDEMHEYYWVCKLRAALAASAAVPDKETS